MTISIPTTLRLVIPNAHTRIPPAFVATKPPIVALSRAAKSTANSQPFARTSSCTWPSVAPAPTVTYPEISSNSRISVKDLVDTRHTSRSDFGGGTEPPTNPVLPPWI